MAAAMEAGALLACNALVRGDIEIAQYSADGTKKIAVLKEVNRVGQIFHRWTPEAEPCRVRFTFNRGAYREANAG